MEVQYNYINDEYFVEEKYDGQIYHMSFYGGTNNKEDLAAFGVYLYITSKRKHEPNFENEIQETGKHPFYSVKWAIKAFNQLEQEVLNEELEKYKKVIIFVRWIDNRRRDAYYKILNRKGYEYNFYNGKKCIAKEFINEKEF